MSLLRYVPRLDYHIHQGREGPPGSAVCTCTGYPDANRHALSWNHNVACLSLASKHISWFGATSSLLFCSGPYWSRVAPTLHHLDDCSAIRLFIGVCEAPQIQEWLRRCPGYIGHALALRGVDGDVAQSCCEFLWATWLEQHAVLSIVDHLRDATPS